MFTDSIFKFEEKSFIERFGERKVNNLERWVQLSPYYRLSLTKMCLGDDFTCCLIKSLTHWRT